MSEEVNVSMFKLDQKDWEFVITWRKIEMMKQNFAVFAVPRVRKSNFYHLNTVNLSDESKNHSVQERPVKIEQVSFDELKQKKKIYL